MPGGGLAGLLDPESLMEAISPVMATSASRVYRENGCSYIGLLVWWTVFLTFLLENESVVFSLRSKGPFWDAYARVYNEKVGMLGIASCPRVEGGGRD